MKLTLSHELDDKFKVLAENLPPIQIEIMGIKQTINKQPLYVNHHAEILCHYLKEGKKGVKAYVMAIQKRVKNTETVKK
jgi:hypothetical protein